jgi:hypothetical protein
MDEKSLDITKPDPFASMIFFFIVTSVYCIINIFMGIGSTMKQIVMKACYILFIIIGQYFINLNLSYAMCGVYQWQNVLTITIIPWLLIFGVLQLFLSMFTGWLSPFSNTFGYLVTKLMGLPELMKNDILSGPIEGDETATRALLNVTSDQSLLINQMYPDPVITDGKDPITKRPIKIRPIFDATWNKLEKSKIFKTITNPSDKIDIKDKLYHFVEMKHTISEFIWNLLTGFLVTSVSYNYIINMGCKKSVKDMENRYNSYNASQKIKASQAAAEQSIQPTYTQS